jgi:hypothetical protein
MEEEKNQSIEMRNIMNGRREFLKKAMLVLTGMVASKATNAFASS